MPALVLLDEVGSGTDPIEGGALGVAVVDHFRRRGATVIATSHYDALKTYAATTEEVTGAAFGFEADTFEPTYQLVYGSAGRSLALEIAGRLGLNPSIVASARQHLSAREAQLSEHLAKIDRDMRALEHEHRLATRERQTLEAAEARFRQREDLLRHREETFRNRLNEEIETQVRRARREIDEVIAQLKAKTAAIATERTRTVSTGETGAVRSDARAAVDTVVKRFLEPVEALAAQAPPGHAPGVGDRVVVGGLGLEGVVTAVHDGTADLDVRGKRMRASLRDLRVVGAAVGRGSRESQRERAAAAARRRHVGSERDWVQRRRGHRARRAVSRRIAARRSAHRAADSRIRHRAAEARDRLLSSAAPARRQLRGGAARAGRRRRDGRRSEGLMALFPQQFIEDLRQQVNIVSVIQDYVSLKHVGNNHKGLCPFHSEKTPSFTVHADKGFFHCFGCNAGGDVFKFLELHEKIGFQDAVRMLAQKFGVAIPETRRLVRRCAAGTRACAKRC